MLKYKVRESIKKGVSMNIIDVKNNLVKLCYEEDIALSGFVKIKDSNKMYIAQVLHLEATRVGKVAIAKLIFNYDDKIISYDGSIPSLRAIAEPLDTKFILDTIHKENPLALGKTIDRENNIVVDFDILNENPIILSEKFNTTKVLLNNLAIQLQARKKKLVVFDTAGIFNFNKLKIAKDFKLPLNKSTINYIYEKGFVDATAESKALIQSIFEELGEYSKTVEFIPFDTFKAVVDSEFMRTKLIQLIIMKNKIKQIQDWNVFAQTPQEYQVLKTKFENDSTVVIDISNIKKSLQKECIKYVYSILAGINEEFYAFTPLSGESSDKALLSQIAETENVHTSIICDYDYSNLAELKKTSKNMLMFSPLKQQKDFGSYNVFLQKLAEDEFIAFGKMTRFIPLIGKLELMKSTDAYVPAAKEATPTIPVPAATPQPAEPQAEEEKPVIQHVELPKETEAVFEEEEPTEEPQEETAAEETTEEAPAPAEAEETITVDEQKEIETIDAQPIEEITTPAAETIEVSEIAVSQVASASAEEVIKQAEVPAPEAPVPTPEQNPVEQALNEVPDLAEEDEELSDDDLDMIESLSKPNEEIPAINEEPQPQPQPQAEPEPIPAEPVTEEEPAATVSEEPQPAPQPEPQEEKPQSVDEEINSAELPKQAEPLQTRANSSPVVPEYAAQFPDEDRVNSDAFREGDRVVHEEFGEGVVEKLINYGDKILASVNFASVGRRLLNPDISEMKRI